MDMAFASIFIHSEDGDIFFVPFIDGRVIVSHSSILNRMNDHCEISLFASVGMHLGKHIWSPVRAYTEVHDDKLYLLEQCMSSIYIAKAKTIEPASTDPSCSKAPKEVDSPCQEDVNEVILVTSPDSISVEEVQDPWVRTILDVILKKSLRSVLKKIVQACTSFERVHEIPKIYNGDCVFELKPTFGKSKNMEGMEQKYDGHCWTKPQTQSTEFEGIVRKSYCGGVFECHNMNCGYLFRTCTSNNTSWQGQLLRIVPVGAYSMGSFGTLQCFYCKSNAICIGRCEAFAYYVMPYDSTYTRLMIHRGNHAHAVQIGISRHSLKNVRDLVEIVIKADKSTGPRKVQMIVAKEMILKALTQKDRSPDDFMGDVEVYQILQELQPITQLNRIKQMVIISRKKITPYGDGIDALFELKRTCCYDFFHWSKFPGQGGVHERCYVFKMSTTGHASGVDIVNRMRRTGNGDLKCAWVCFDHVRRVEGWSTIAAHVYDPSVQELLTIATCEMKEEDTDAQVLFWTMVNRVMIERGHELPDFYGFMADEAQSNWRAVRTLYNGGPDNVMIGRERTCLFHWKQSLIIHTNKYIFERFRDEHLKICEAWRTSATKDDAFLQYRFIRAWWENGHVKDKDIPHLDSWLSWWHFRVSHWSDFMCPVRESKEAAMVPRVNLAESKHGSWLAGEGYRNKISLYDAAVTDMANSLLQSTRQQAYFEGRHIGSGPSLEILIQRSLLMKENTPLPKQASTIMQNALCRTTMYTDTTCLQGDRESTRKRRQPKTAKGVDINSTHRPEFISTIHDRPQKGRPRKLFMSVDKADNNNNTLNEMVLERHVHDTFWAIRRTNPGSKVRCQGWLGSSLGKCNKVISQGNNGVPAPSFNGIMMWPSGQKMQLIWFCNSDVKHARIPGRHIMHQPATFPQIWPVIPGTSLTKEEIVLLKQGGFEVEMHAIDEDPNQGTTTQTFSEDKFLQTPNESNMSQKHERSHRENHYRSHVSVAASKKIDKALCLKACILEERVILQFREEIFVVETEGSLEKGKPYDVYISKNPSCTCEDFQSRERNRKPYLACKHLYFVYMRVLGQDKNHNMVIHQPILDDPNLHRMLSVQRTYPYM